MIFSEDIPHFFAEASNLNLEDYILFKYCFETSEDPRLVAAQLCLEQSTAQWRRPGVEEDFRVLYGAKVVALTPHPSRDAGHPLPQGERDKRYEVTVAHPHRNFGPRLPNLLSAAAGEGPFYCPGIRFIKWVDVSFPQSFLKQFEGPQFGLKGIRKELAIYDRPLFVGVVKPNLGLNPRSFSELAYQAWMGGLDMAKDDEMLGDSEWSPISERSLWVGKARRKAEHESGKKKIFIANITDEVDRMIPLHDLAVGNEVNAVMLNVIFMGLSSLRVLRRKSQVPLMSHFTGTACFSRLPNFGIRSLVMTKLQRLAGADMIGLAGFGERMHTTDTEVIADIEACLSPWGNILPSLPMPGGSDWAGTLPRVYGKIGHRDFGFISGRGIFSHPLGPTAGARSLLEAWEAVRQGISLESYAKDHEALRSALKAFGDKESGVRSQESGEKK